MRLFKNLIKQTMQLKINFEFYMTYRNKIIISRKCRKCNKKIKQSMDGHLKSQFKKANIKIISE